MKIMFCLFFTIFF